MSCEFSFFFFQNGKMETSKGNGGPGRGRGRITARREAVRQGHEPPILGRHRQAGADPRELGHRLLQAAVGAEPEGEDAADGLEVRVGHVAALGELAGDGVQGAGPLVQLVNRAEGQSLRSIGDQLGVGLE